MPNLSWAEDPCPPVPERPMTDPFNFRHLPRCCVRTTLLHYAPTRDRNKVGSAVSGKRFDAKANAALASEGAVRQ